MEEGGHKTLLTYSMSSSVLRVRAYWSYQCIYSVPKSVYSTSIREWAVTASDSTMDIGAKYFSLRIYNSFWVLVDIIMRHAKRTMSRKRSARYSFESLFRNTSRWLVALLRERISASQRWTFSSDVSSCKIEHPKTCEIIRRTETAYAKAKATSNVKHKKNRV